MISIEGMENVATLPSRKFAHDCWKALVPVGTPVGREAERAFLIGRVFGLVVAIHGEAEAQRLCRPVIQFRLSNQVKFLLYSLYGP